MKVEQITRFAKTTAPSLVFGTDGSSRVGFAADLVTDMRRVHVSLLEGEDEWHVDGISLLNGLPVFYNGQGSRCCAHGVYGTGTAEGSALDSALMR